MSPIKQQTSGSFGLGRAAVEALEGRRLLTASPEVQFTNFASTTGLVTNGYGGSADTAANALVLTNGAVSEARSVWWHVPVGVNTFSTTFSFDSVANPNTADGFTFTLQNQGTSAVGAGGQGLGFTGITPSIAVSFALYNVDADTFGSDFRFEVDGADTSTIVPTAMAPIDLHGGDQFDATVSYDGTTLSVHVVDHNDVSDTFNASEAINLKAVLGSDTAFAGFTGGTGAEASTQNVLDWSYTGSATPTVVTAAEATPSPVTAKTTDLSVLGADVDGESELTYTWTVLKKPPGAKAVLFSSNGSNASQDTTATFSKYGQYDFRCTITDDNGLTIESDVDVHVNQTAHQLKLTPHKQTITEGTTQQFTATVFDQFGHAMVTQPSFVYSELNGPGSIDASTGLYTASKTLGHVNIKAAGGGLVGTVGAVVLA